MSAKPAVKTAPKTQPAKRKAEAAVATSESIDNQIAAFLASGGEIQSIPSGTSGQTYGKPASKTAAKPQKA
ncbi:hypothetical protein BN1049_00543 [Pseudomonas saudimassiliensis]|uniref:Transcriptional regulator SutA RNAP-binding domain-containing protein n=1 Tax=Pseudomonas saudimassiliensis TaxID=1461581 RepID=A0A078M6B0_9PSED|nr:hypothetical protein [Pseudomonas saudimassiliensis]CEA01805.1 hypothetical protein BN1049_00543 [Pseudomonas saudimassiliensis]CEF25633.1 hypothetical protein BN1049_00543 [Pseudomonas saudimassiliensis]